MLLTRPKLHVLKLNDVSIFDQLKLEEYLLRDTHENYCIINYGSTPSIVMGISGKVDELVHTEDAKKHSVPVIKRFSGGGTVVVDEDTLFVTFIFNATDVNVDCFPEPIYKFTESIYQDVFKDLPFELKQNDYIFNERKFGGNAQYIKKNRWLHHTSFLWDYKPYLMSLLKHPKKTPEYRKDRSHDEFVCKMKDFIQDKDTFISIISEVLSSKFEIEILKDNFQKNEASRSSTEYLKIENIT